MLGGEITSRLITVVWLTPLLFILLFLFAFLVGYLILRLSPIIRPPLSPVIREHPQEIVLENVRSPTTSSMSDPSVEPTTIVETLPRPKTPHRYKTSKDWISIQTRPGGFIWMIRTLRGAFGTRSSTNSWIHNFIPFILSFLGLKFTGDQSQFHSGSRIVVNRALYATSGLTFWWIIDTSRVRGQLDYTQRCMVYQLPAQSRSQYLHIDQQLLSLTGLHGVSSGGLKVKMVFNQTHHRNVFAITMRDAFERIHHPRSLGRLVVTDTNLPIVSRGPSIRRMELQLSTNKPYFISNENGNELYQVTDPKCSNPRLRFQGGQSGLHTNIRLLTQESGYTCLLSANKVSLIKRPDQPSPIMNRIYLTRTLNATLVNLQIKYKRANISSVNPRLFGR